MSIIRNDPTGPDAAAVVSKFAKHLADEVSVIDGAADFKGIRAKVDAATEATTPEYAEGKGTLKTANED